MSLPGRVIAGIRHLDVDNARLALFQMRSTTAPPWRKLVRIVTVILGYSVFVILQLSLAYGVLQGQWVLLLSSFSAVVLIVLAFVNPTLVFVVWLAITPVATLFFRLDFGTDVPAITLDRVVINALALSLIIRHLGSKPSSDKRAFRLGEILLIAFPIYLALSAFFLHYVSIPNLMVLIMARGGDFAVIYFVARGCIRNISQVNKVLWACMILALYISVLAILDQMTGSWFIFKLIGRQAHLITHGGSEAGRSAGPFTNPFDLAIVLGFLIMLIFHIGNVTSSRILRTCSYMMIPLCVMAWAFTYSRSTYPVFILGVLAMPFLAQSKRPRYIAFASVFVLLGLITIPIMLSKPLIRDRFLDPSNALPRIATDVAMFNMFKAHPIIGIGLGNAVGKMGEYAESFGGVAGLNVWSTVGSPSSKTNISTQWGPHNTQFVILAEHGVIGALFYFGTYIAFFLSLLGARRSMPKYGLISRDVYAMLAVGLFGLVTLSFSGGYYDSIKFCMILVWVLMGVFLKAYDLQMADEKTTQALVDSKNHAKSLEGANIE